MMNLSALFFPGVKAGSAFLQGAKLSTRKISTKNK